MIVSYVVRNLEAAGLGDINGEQRVVCKGRINYSRESRSFGMRCREWLEAGYTIETWKDG